MTKEQKETVENALVKFIIRATSDNALPEEKRVLPELVEALVLLSNN